MIAVFTPTEREYRSLRLYPEHEFIRIKDYRDLLGRRFTGVVQTCPEHQLESNTQDALEPLRGLEPDLFRRAE